MNINLEIRLYNDLMLIEAFQQNKNKDYFVKNAFSFSDFTNSVKTYFTNQIQPNNKFESITNLIAPGIIATAFGGGKLAILVNLVASAMGIDFGKMLTTVWSKLSNKFKNETITESDIDSTVNSVIASQDDSMSDEQQNNAAEMLKRMASLSFNDINQLKSLSNDVSNKLLNGDKLSKIKEQIIVQAKRSGIKLNLILFLGKLIKFIFIALMSALGINLTTNVVKKVLNKPNAFDGPVNQPKSNRPTSQSYQNKQYNQSGSTWIENYDNTTQGISNMLLDFAKDVYGNIDTNKIKNTSAFAKTVNTIEQYNIVSVGDRMVFIPKTFKTKQDLVDTFIDEKLLDIDHAPINTQNKNEDLGPKTVII